MEQNKRGGAAPDCIQIRGARVHNLKNLDIDIPLGKLVAIAGVSGSGKSSLALGVLYAEGSRRYLEALSAYTRRRMTQAAEAKIDSIENVPAALALHQRPAVPGIRSTFGTATELLNSLRLLFSRLGSHRCPNGHYLEPSAAVAMGKRLVCPVCGVAFDGPAAEDFSFNSGGACRTCGGTGIVRTVDEASLVPDESLSIDEGAVAPWNSLMWSLMTDVCRAMGVRTDVPFSELTDRERDIVFHGPAVKKLIFYKAKSSNQAGELDFTYYNAVYTVENALAKVKDDKGMKRVEKFLKQDVCPDCGGTRLSERARSTRLCGLDLGEASAMTLDALIPWVQAVPAAMPESLRDMADSIAAQFLHTAKRLVELGLGYLSLDRAGATLSTGERQRVQLARAVRNHTTGVLYVLDEPSIGLHPANVDGLLGMLGDLTAHGNLHVSCCLKYAFACHCEKTSKTTCHVHCQIKICLFYNVINRCNVVGSYKRSYKRINNCKCKYCKDCPYNKHHYNGCLCSTIGFFDISFTKFTCNVGVDANCYCKRKCNYYHGHWEHDTYRNE